MFTSANLLLPKVDDLQKWAVVACDQFTSQPDYWEKVKNFVGYSPSAYNLILPEAMLNKDIHDEISRINLTMNNYLEQKIFTEYKNSYVYVERTLLDGSIRKGIVGVIDLEEYDYKPGSKSKIRATEQTVSERIPVRKEIRENSILELSHVILLCDDERRDLIEPLKLSKHSMRKLYDFNLMQNGGNVKGWLVKGEHARAFSTRLNLYIKRKSKELEVLFAVGDGNHSLAAAKKCYEEGLTSRYAMVELENIHDESLKFEPIHRIVKNINPSGLLNSIRSEICVNTWASSKNSWPIKFYSHNKEGVVNIAKAKGASALIVLQNYFDEKKYEIDYIHDSEFLKELSDNETCVGFELPKFDEKAKSEFFSVISKNGVMPRKTFSMGYSTEKRYYIEARKIKDVG
ncbi:MAG: DUF1015 domain-containing protein [Synergistaceae bacterium]|nr:DUF1015 domain-containing protein [Synergistaceae bacterium]